MPIAEALVLAAAVSALPFWVFRRAGAAGTFWAALGTAVVGAGAWRWGLLGGAFAVAHWDFFAMMARFFTPVLLAATLGVLFWACVDEDFRPNRPAWALGLAGLWAAAAGLTEWRMRSAYGYGPRSLPEAAGISAAGASPDFAVAILASRSERPVKAVRRRAFWAGVDLSQASLLGLSSYLSKSEYRGIFVPDALEALRRGWLLKWEEDQALASSSLRSPGRLTPDWLQALALIRAGPLTELRKARLDDLSALAESGAGGFDQVGKSQRIFEGFSAAYARFGEEEDSRRWLLKVDKLWPLYEKRIEVTPVEFFTSGEIHGSVHVEGLAPGALRVGLFHVTGGTRPYEAYGDLAAGVDCGPDGSFRFANLGEGRYYLAVSGPARAIGASFEPSPGMLSLSAALPTLRLAPIRGRLSSPGTAPPEIEYNEK